MTSVSPLAEEGSGVPGQELAGVRVADFSAVMAGPYCTRLMADLGAEVVKVEPPGGEHTRTVMPHRDGVSAYYGMLNAGKRSVCLDLRTESARRAAKTLCGWADVVVENFRPGVMDRFGLDYPTLAADHPKLVYCSISGYGQDGPWRDRPATAQAIHATSGYDLGLLGYQQDRRRPASTGMFVADALAGALAFGAISTALATRALTGRGRSVDLSLLDTILSMMVGEVQAAQFPDSYHRRSYPPLPTTDGYVMIAVVTQRHFEGMAKVIGQPELVDDDRFRSNADRWRHSGDLHEILEDWSAQRTAAECEDEMLAAGVPATRYRTVAEQFSLPQLTERETFIDAEDSAGRFRVVGAPFQFRTADGVREDRRARPVLPVSDCGADTWEVLASVLGAEEASRLIDEGAAMTAAGSR